MFTKLKIRGENLEYLTFSQSEHNSAVKDLVIFCKIINDDGLHKNVMFS